MVMVVVAALHMHHLIQAYRRLVSLSRARFYVLYDFYRPPLTAYQRGTRALDSETFFPAFQSRGMIAEEFIALLAEKERL